MTIHATLFLLSHLGPSNDAGLAPDNKDADVPAEMLKFNRLTFHELSGTVEVKDEGTLRIRDFVYDGTGPDAFFIVGKEGFPSGDYAFPAIVDSPEYKPGPFSYDDTSIDILRRYDGEDVEVVLPPEVKASQIKWISLYCRFYKMDFGHVIFP